MLDAFIKGFAELRHPKAQGLLALALASAGGVFVGLWALVGYGLGRLQLFAWTWVNGLVEILGTMGAMALTWLLYPVVVSLIVGIFLDGVAGAVEARHYPGLPPARQQGWWEILLSSTGFVAVSVALNLLVLPLYLIPGLNLFVFYGLNGYLLSREYFELVALRRLTPPEAKDLRRRVRWPLYLAGGLIAFLLTVPVVNLAAPVVATAAMVHLFEAWRRIAAINDKGIGP